MALAKTDSLTRGEVGTALNVPNTRGIIMNNEQVEMVLVVKLTGDTTGSIDLSNVKRPQKVWVIPTRDSAGANSTSLAMTEVTFTRTDDDTIAMSSLGTWTVAILLVTGRSYVN